MPSARSHRHPSGSQTPEIIVYPNRRRTMVWLCLGAGSFLVALLIVVFILISIILVPAARNGAAIFTVVFLVGVGFPALWAMRVLARLLTSHAPTLAITHQGIRVGHVYGSFEIMLPWEEVEAIYLFGGGIEKQLAIRPRNVKRFLSHFGLLMRFSLRINLLTGAPITLTQSLLDQPITEILDQVEERYAPELDAYHIRLWRPHQR